MADREGTERRKFRIKIKLSVINCSYP